MRLFYGYFTVGYGYFTAGLRLFYDLSTVILRLEYGEMASWEVPETEKPAQFKTNKQPNPTRRVIPGGGGAPGGNSNPASVHFGPCGALPAPAAMFSDGNWGANGEAAVVVNLEALHLWLSSLGEIVM